MFSIASCKTKMKETDKISYFCGYFTSLIIPHNHILRKLHPTFWFVSKIGFFGTGNKFLIYCNIYYSSQTDDTKFKNLQMFICKIVPEIKGNYLIKKILIKIKICICYWIYHTPRTFRHKFNANLRYVIYLIKNTRLVKWIC